MSVNKKIDFGVKAFIIRDGKFLVMHNNGEKRDLWELPGGRMQFGENAEQTLKREMMEETGLEVNLTKILDTWDRLAGDDYQVTGIICLCSAKEGQVVISDEHDSYQWLPIKSSSVECLYDHFRSRMVKWDWNALQKHEKVQAD